MFAVGVPAACRVRMTCRQLLESVTCYDVMPRKTCVVVIDSELPVNALQCYSQRSFRKIGTVGTLLLGRTMAEGRGGVCSCKGASGV